MLFYLVLVSLLGCVVCGPPTAKSREEIAAFREFLESTRTDDGVRFHSNMLANPQAKIWQNSGKYQGDILLDDEQIELMVAQFAQGRNAYIWPRTHWPLRTVVYEFGPGFDNAQRNAILAAIRDIQRHTCVTFRQRRSGERNFVRITGQSNGCYAHVGYWETRGVHTFNLALNRPGRGCFHHNVIIHEWLHVIGFFHMQSTHNRDSFVRIMWQNIASGMAHNFDKYSPQVVSNLGLPYEYDSNMHYDRWGFSINGQPTMLPIFNDRNLMGQIEYVTRNDWLRVNRHYNCPGAWNEPLEDSQTDNEPAWNEPLEDSQTDNEPAWNEPLEDSQTDNEPAWNEPLEDSQTDNEPAWNEPLEDLQTDNEQD